MSNSENKEILREYSVEPVFGHRYQIQVYEPDNTIATQLDEMREEMDLPEKDRTKVQIIEHDVEWDEPRKITMRQTMFEEFIEWYNNE